MGFGVVIIHNNRSLRQLVNHRAIKLFLVLMQQLYVLGRLALENHIQFLVKVVLDLEISEQILKNLVWYHVCLIIYLHKLNKELNMNSHFM